MSTPTITIHMDAKCAECGKPGATDSGICFTCIPKAMKDKPMKSAAGRVIQGRFKEIKQLKTELGRR